VGRYAGAIVIRLRLLKVLLLIAFCVPPIGADTFARQHGVDVLHYRFELAIADTSDTLSGRVGVDIRILDADVQEFVLDLVGTDSAPPGYGMSVSGARWEGANSPADFSHAVGKLTVPFASPVTRGERRRLWISYAGVPETGLIIGDNKHGQRCFFSNNWPNKARHWLPMVDHPYDKATADMIVNAPGHYQAVSNGLLVEETDLADGMRRTHWRQSVPIASWLYALGVARFAVDHRPPLDGIPIQTWVFATDRDDGFDDFSEPTRHVLEFFSDYIGPYPYEKLANVQSNSVGGGMESATAIFYDDDSVTGEHSERWRSVVTHEIAHQWWGNSVTEADWDDVWLSEGFATYFTLLFLEHERGRDAFVKGLERSRRGIFDFQGKRPDYRLVHDDLRDMNHVLTVQIYQKGAWVLHMLRAMLGDDPFRQGIREYYRLYRDGNATTGDFVQVMEEVAGRDLGWFFDQWLYRGGSLEVEGTWSWEAGTLVVELGQTQETPEIFRMPITIEVVGPDGGSTVHVVELIEQTGRYEMAVDSAPESVRLDPQVEVLMRATFAPR